MNFIKMRRYLMTLMMFIVAGISSCEKNEFNNITGIKYGSSFGMCAGNNCFNELTINDNQISYTSHGNGSSPVKNCTGPANPNLLKELKALAASNNISKLDNFIGCPDCADGGAEWIEVEEDGRTKKVTFEYGKAPETLAALVNKLKPVSDSFFNCK